MWNSCPCTGPQVLLSNIKRNRVVGGSGRHEFSRCIQSMLRPAPCAIWRGIQEQSPRKKNRKMVLLKSTQMCLTCSRLHCYHFSKTPLSSGHCSSTLQTRPLTFLHQALHVKPLLPLMPSAPMELPQLDHTCKKILAFSSSYL
jgi:hypothetical protein